MEEEELSEILLPSNNKFVREFIILPQEKQIQILNLGLSTYNYSSQKFKNVIAAENEERKEGGEQKQEQKEQEQQQQEQKDGQEQQQQQEPEQQPEAGVMPKAEEQV